MANTPPSGSEGQLERLLQAISRLGERLQGVVAAAFPQSNNQSILSGTDEQLSEAGQLGQGQRGGTQLNQSEVGESVATPNTEFPLDGFEQVKVGREGVAQPISPQSQPTTDALEMQAGGASIAPGFIGTTGSATGPIDAEQGTQYTTDQKPQEESSEEPEALNQDQALAEIESGPEAEPEPEPEPPAPTPEPEPQPEPPAPTPEPEPQRLRQADEEEPIEGENPGNDRPVGNSPFDGETGASDQPGRGQTQDGADPESNQPPGADRNSDPELSQQPPAKDADSESQLEPSASPEPEGSNPGNDRPAGFSPFDGETGASDQPGNGPTQDGEDPELNQPPGAERTTDRPDGENASANQQDLASQNKEPEVQQRDNNQADELGANPGNDLEAGFSPFDGETGASDQPGNGQTQDSRDPELNQPPGAERTTERLDGENASPDQQDIASPNNEPEAQQRDNNQPDEIGANPGNDLETGFSPFDGETGASDQPGNGQTQDGQDPELNQPTGEENQIVQIDVGSEGPKQVEAREIPEEFETPAGQSDDQSDRDLSPTTDRTEPPAPEQDTERQEDIPAQNNQQQQPDPAQPGQRIEDESEQGDRSNPGNDKPVGKPNEVLNSGGEETNPEAEAPTIDAPIVTGISSSESIDLNGILEKTAKQMNEGSPSAERGGRGRDEQEAQENSEDAAGAFEVMDSAPPQEDTHIGGRGGGKGGRHDDDGHDHGGGDF